jgi:thymine-DNA glycosylase
MTASLGHPYSHPSNGFWKTLYTSGITPIRHRPQDHLSLPDLYGIGNTNICARPSRQGSDLSKAELLEGAKILDDKMTFYRPEAACISGKGVWEAMWAFKTGKKKMPSYGEGAFRYGWQDEKLWLGRVVDEESREVLWKGAMTFVAPSTSGLNAGMSPTEKEQAWKPIGEWMRKKRMERELRETNGTEEQTVSDIAAVVKHSEDLGSRDHSRGKKITPRTGNMKGAFRDNI